MSKTLSENKAFEQIWTNLVQRAKFLFNFFSNFLFQLREQTQRLSHLTHFSPMSHFYTPWKRQKTSSFMTFSGGIKWNIGLKWVKINNVYSQAALLICVEYQGNRTILIMLLKIKGEDMRIRLFSHSLFFNV